MSFFSILVPSRGGEDYISNVLKSVLDQDFNDYEIIVGDNNNSEKFKTIVQSFNSNKIKIVSSEKTLQVAESWSNCLNKSKGKYIVTLGDDDCLLPGGLFKIKSLLDKFKDPDCLSVNGVGFYEKGSTKDIIQSSYKRKFWEYKKSYLSNIFLSKLDKEVIIKEFFSFNNLLPLNMQPHIFSKEISMSVEGGLFKPPSPDSYALYSMLNKDKKWAISDEKVFAIGLSKKSFGHYWHNQKIDAGIKFLGSSLDGDFLPGSKLNDYLYTVLKNLKKNQKSFNKYKIQRSPYVVRQFFVSFESSLLNRDFKYIFEFIKSIKLMDIFRLFKGLLMLKFYIYGLTRIFRSLKKEKLLTKDLVSLEKEMNIYDFSRKNYF